MNIREIITRAQDGTLDDYNLVDVDIDPDRPTCHVGRMCYIGGIDWVPNPNISWDAYVKKYCKRGKIVGLVTYPRGNPLYRVGDRISAQYRTTATVELETGDVDYIYTDHLVITD